VPANKLIGAILAGLGWLLATQAALSGPTLEPLLARTERIVDRLLAGSGEAAPGDLRIEHCSGYPYAEQADPDGANARLVGDLAAGLATGLACLAGQGPMGRLHPYHEYQAHRLLKLFESDRPKTFRCVADEMFATAVATGPTPPAADDPLYAQLRGVPHPAVVIDLYRLGGLLSRRFDDATYRNFFHLAEDQILEHRSGQPLRANNLHRYRDRPSLLFHEVVHWLGHEHSAIFPDVAHLYETCCFGGSDYIDDDERNRRHQASACRILKDDALWSEGHNRYRQMRVWHYKGYDRLKSDMRADYDR
jgi:hypothetical protein